MSGSHSWKKLDSEIAADLSIHLIVDTIRRQTPKGSSLAAASSALSSAFYAHSASWMNMVERFPGPSQQAILPGSFGSSPNWLNA